MREIPQNLFDVYALSRPRGHGFGDNIPIGSWMSENSLGWATLRRNVDTGEFSVNLARRSIDDTWVFSPDTLISCDQDRVLSFIRKELDLIVERVPLPPGVRKRQKLWDVQSRKIGSQFECLNLPTHNQAAWLLNQLYLSLPSPDPNWVSDCQTDNFHTRLWEALLLACFREQGALVEQPHPSPDFKLSRSGVKTAWVEAVTANAVEKFDQVNAPLSFAPDDTEQRFLGSAASRFAKTLGSKLQKEYQLCEHVRDHPFAIAIADFHAAGSMTWTREPLMGLLYGAYPVVSGADGKNDARLVPAETLQDQKFRAGLFRDDRQSDLSAIIFSNACSLSKLNRLAATLGLDMGPYRYVRCGKIFDRKPGALEPKYFCEDVTSSAYLDFWPQEYEPWSAEMEVFHNPFSVNPLPIDLLPEATHWFEKDGKIQCASHYETSILSSHTWILRETDPIPTVQTMTNGSWIKQMEPILLKRHESISKE